MSSNTAAHFFTPIKNGRTRRASLPFNCFPLVKNQCARRDARRVRPLNIRRYAWVKLKSIDCN